MKCCNYYCKKAFAFLFFASLVISSACIRSNISIPFQVDQEAVEFNYDEGSGRGPSSWGSLKPEWQTCGTGTSQSPIDIPASAQNSDLGDLKRSYTSGSAVLRNRGHDVAVFWNGDVGTITINGIDFRIIQCHWHSPAEHTFGGIRHDLEIHILHQNDQSQNAVVSMVFHIGLPDPFLSSLLSSIRGLGRGEIDLGNVSPLDIGFNSRSYYRYTGSLSTPPCTEGVIWTVFQEVKTASAEQIQALKDVLAPENKDNSRPTQSLGGRQVLLYDPGAIGGTA